jgi:hypothetical protein
MRGIAVDYQASIACSVRSLIFSAWNVDERLDGNVVPNVVKPLLLHIAAVAAAAALAPYY